MILCLDGSIFVLIDSENYRLYIAFSRSGDYDFFRAGARWPFAFSESWKSPVDSIHYFFIFRGFSTAARWGPLSPSRI